MTIKTDKLVKRLNPILDEALEYMAANNANLPYDFESRLCRHLGKSYRRLKPMMIALLDDPRYAYVAVRYMETSNSTGVVAEFRRPLAMMYGIENYDSPEREEARKAFWRGWTANHDESE